MGAIIGVLLALQFLVTLYNLGYGLSKLSIYSSFFIWHLSAIFFYIDDFSWVIVILQLINAAFSYNSLSRLRVVEILEVGSEVDPSTIDYDIEDNKINVVVNEMGSDGTLLYKRVFEMTFQESRFFGIAKQSKVLKVPVSLEDATIEDLRRVLVGVKFDVIV
jgi:hypothetical protein